MAGPPAWRRHLRYSTPPPRRGQPLTSGTALHEPAQARRKRGRPGCVTRIHLAELSPRFEITCYRATTGNRADLRLTFTGPSALDRLDGVTVTVRDDRTNRTSVTMGGPSDEELARVVWGPYRFVPGVNGADALGKAIPNFSLDRQETARLALEESLAPRWVSDHSFWRQQYADHPLRLMIICTRAGHKPWNVIVDVPIEPESTTQAR